LTLASERQISANQRNASRSTGPRSAAGKKRTGQNAYRHGLTSSLRSSAATSKWIEECARKIAGDEPTAIVLEHARVAAQAELDLAHIRQIKVALLERASAFATLDPGQEFESSIEELRYLGSVLSGRTSPIVAERIDDLATIPTEERGLTAEAVRTTLVELIKLNRYESRAASRRDRAIRQIVKIKSSGDRFQDSDDLDFLGDANGKPSKVEE
jgi:hypothetical protein